MNISYQKWFEARITHTYFPDAICPVLDIQPLSATRTRLKNFNILAKKKGNVFSMYLGYDPSKTLQLTEALQGLDSVFFQVTMQDIHFFNYTQIPSLGEQEVFYFQNGINQNNADLLQKEDFVSKADILPLKPWNFTVSVPKKEVEIEIKDRSGEVITQKKWDGTLVSQLPVDLSVFGTGVYEVWIDGVLSETVLCTQGLPENCLGILCLDTSTLPMVNEEEATFSLDFKTRSVFWQYQVVVSDMRKIQVQDLKVTGTDKTVFDGPVSRSIVGGQNAKVFTSPQPLPLFKVPGQSPQLEIAYTNDFSNRKNRLEIKLPNPETEDLIQVEEGGKKSLLTTTIIYV